MILNILIFKNIKLDCFTTPQFDDHEPEVAAIQLARSIKINPNDEKARPFKNLKLYVLGKFDDSTGKIDLLSKPKLLLDCSKLFPEEDVLNEKVPK